MPLETVGSIWFASDAEAGVVGQVPRRRDITAACASQGAGEMCLPWLSFIDPAQFIEYAPQLVSPLPRVGRLQRNPGEHKQRDALLLEGADLELNPVWHGQRPDRVLAKPHAYAEALTRFPTPGMEWLGNPEFWGVLAQTPQFFCSPSRRFVRGPSGETRITDPVIDVATGQIAFLVSPQMPVRSSFRGYRPNANGTAWPSDQTAPVINTDLIVAMTQPTNTPARRFAIKPLGATDRGRWSVLGQIDTEDNEIGWFVNWQVPSPRAYRPFVPHPDSQGDFTPQYSQEFVALMGWHVQPQVPARKGTQPPRAYAEPASDPNVWYGTLTNAVLRTWDVSPQTPVRPSGRRQGFGAGVGAGSTVDSPDPQFVPQPDGFLSQSQNWPRPWKHRPRPESAEFIAAPPIYSSGVSITVSGPYYVIEAELYCAGPVEGMVVSL